jgi:hypothetical protein
VSISSLPNPTGRDLCEYVGDVLKIGAQDAGRPHRIALIVWPVGERAHENSRQSGSPPGSQNVVVKIGKYHDRISARQETTSHYKIIDQIMSAGSDIHHTTLDVLLYVSLGQTSRNRKRSANMHR